MKRALWCAVCVVATVVVGKPYDDAMAAFDKASVESKGGRYAEAATALTTAADALEQGGDKTWPAQLRLMANLYKQRATNQSTAATDPRAARALLKSLLVEPPAMGVKYDRANAEDPRVAALIQTLRAKDPSAKEFFTPRKVKVVVSGDALTTDQATATAASVVSALKGMGFEASVDAGDETLELPVTVGKFSAPDFLGGADGEFKCPVTWTDAKGKSVVSFELGVRGPMLASDPRSFVDKNWKRLGTAFAPRLFAAWNGK